MTMSKRITVFTIFIFSYHFLSAQNNFTTHTLKQGESLSSLARQYNTSVGDIMRMNGMHADTKLVFGSKIKIPSNKKQNVSSEIVIIKQAAATPQNATKHTVVKGETLYSISKQYNVSLEQLKTWNHLADYNAKLGDVLVVSEGNAETSVAAIPKKQRIETVVAPKESDEEIVIDQTTKQADENKIEPAKEESTLVVKDYTINNNSAATQTDFDYSGNGFFATQFKEKKQKRLQNVYGVSKTFKTASGWADGKFYILADNIEPGTIVKVTADNGSSVFAKVLWNMGDLKQNAGVDFRVSNATAAALHVSEQSFNVNIAF